MGEMEIRRCHILCTLLISALLTACEPAGHTPPASAPAGSVPINEGREAPSKLELKWGTLRVPLFRHANPEVYRGQAEVPLSAFRQNLSEEIQLLQSSRELKVQALLLHRGGSERFQPLQKGSRLTEARLRTYQQRTRAGEELYLQVRTAGEVLVQSVTFKIADPFETYEPAVKVPQPHFTEEIFGFQVIQETGQRPCLRIDTAAEATRHIYELYQQNNIYKIIHVPGFQTHRRLLTDREQLFSTQEVRSATVLADGPSWRSLPEYIDYKGPEVKLQWGDMEAMPMSVNYNLWEFRANMNQPLQLMVGDRPLPIHSFRITLQGEGRHPAFWVTHHLQESSLQKALHQLGGAATVYCSNIIVEPAPDSLLLFPQAFAFSIEARRHYYLELKEAAGGGGYVDRSDSTYVDFQFDGVPLSQVLPELLGIDRSQMHFQHFEHNPRLQIRFRSAQYTKEDGASLVLQQLEERYGIQLDWIQVPRQYKLTIAEEKQLSRALSTEAGSERLIREGHIREALFLYYTIDAMTELLSQELGYEIINATGVPAHYRLRAHIGYSSVSAARESLRDIGLRLQRSRECATVVVAQQ